MKIPAILLLVVLSVQSATAARRPKLTFSGTTQLPTAGLELRLMTGAAAQPVPPPQAVMYRGRRGDEEWTEERYSPYDLWIRSQLSGAWIDEHGNRFQLAKLGMPYPSDLDQHVQRTPFEKHLETLRIVPDRWRRETMQDWAKAYTGAAKVQYVEMRRPSSKLRSLVRIELDETKSRYFVYFFRLNRLSYGQSKAPDDWFAAIFLVTPETDLEKSRNSIEEHFLPSIAGADKKNGSWPSSPSAAPEAGESSQLRASRDQVKRSIENMEGWWVDETPHFVLLSNLSSRHQGTTLRKIKEHLELLRSAYEEMIPPRTVITAVSTIRVPATPSEYAQYVGSSYAWTSGLWMPGRRELVIRAGEMGNSKSQREQILSTLYHEALHQYVYYALDKIQTSAWFNEGHATLFGAAEPQSSTVSLPEDGRLAKRVEALVRKGNIDLAPLLNLSYAEFYSSNVDQREDNYALAWGLVYYLRKGTSAQSDQLYAAICDRYLDALWRTKDEKKATAEAFAKVTMDGLNESFERFWKSSSRRRVAER